MKNKKFDFKTFFVCLLIVFVFVGGIGSFFTSKNTNTEWYQSIKPSITPPNWIFPVIWNFLFLLISFSLYFAWKDSKNKIQKKKIILIFGINFILNILWSALFFGLKLTLIAFFEIIFFWISILAMILITKEFSKKSSFLLIPYLLWVSFAGVLNYFVVFF
jgi:translocator protein